MDDAAGVFDGTWKIGMTMMIGHGMMTPEIGMRLLMMNGAMMFGVHQTGGKTIGTQIAK